MKFPTPTPTDPFNAVVVTEDAFDTANLRLSFQRGPLGLDVFGSHETIVRPREVGVEMRYSF